MQIVAGDEVQTGIGEDKEGRNTKSLPCASWGGCCCGFTLRHWQCIKNTNDNDNMAHTERLCGLTWQCQ